MRYPLAASVLVLSALSTALCAQEKFGPRLQFSRGDVHHVHVTFEQGIDQTVKDARQQTRQTIAVGYTLGVEEVDAQGTATLSVHYGSVAFHATTPGGPVDYDSANPPGQVPIMASGLAALVGQGYSIKINAQGNVTQVIGLQPMLDSLLAHLSIPAGVVRIAAEKGLRQQFEEQNLKQTLQNLFAPLPDHPIEIGESWSRATRSNLGIPLTIQSTYTLLSRQDGVATVEVTGKSMTEPDAAMELGPMKLNYDVKGDQNGSLQIVESTGWTKSAEISQHLSGSATLRGPNTDPETVPLTVESKVKSEQR
jgi:hypothetical protein